MPQRATGARAVRGTGSIRGDGRGPRNDDRVTRSAPHPRPPAHGHQTRAHASEERKNAAQPALTWAMDKTQNLDECLTRGVPGHPGDITYTSHSASEPPAHA